MSIRRRTGRPITASAIARPATDAVARMEQSDIRERWTARLSPSRVSPYAQPRAMDGSARIGMTDGAPTPWPTELRLHKDRKTLTVSFDNGETYDLSAEYLRVRSPSAEVQGHSPAESKIIA